MARSILERLFDSARLNALFAETAQVGYTRKLHFATLVGLLGDVVLGGVHFLMRGVHFLITLRLREVLQPSWVDE